MGGRTRLVATTKTTGLMLTTNMLQNDKPTDLCHLPLLKTRVSRRQTNTFVFDKKGNEKKSHCALLKSRGNCENKVMSEASLRLVVWLGTSEPLPLNTPTGRGKTPPLHRTKTWKRATQALRGRGVESQQASRSCSLIAG